MTSNAPRAAYDDVVDEMLHTTPSTTGHMFGMPCLKTGAKAYAALYHDAMIFKLKGADFDAALALQGAHLFKPMPDRRPMREWVAVPVAHSARWSEFTRAALDYVTAGS